MPSARPDPKKLFLDAIENHPRSEWEAFIASVCGGDNDVRERVWNLLRSHMEPASILAESALHQTDDLAGEVEVQGETVGPYKLLERIGEGGMGVVYMAEQQDPVKRMVALKIIKPGMDTKQVVARFEAERQALALMEHPNIARVLDGGSTPSGRPYFAMELVRGVQITEFCDQQQLDMRSRLKLFVPICQAIQHAHQRGMIHRDIKPSNVMVTLHDGDPIVKVIDFGVAKALNRELTERTLFTNYAQVIGTPLYMSPEQAEMSGLDVDTRSDVYSLGVLLYELLTGSTPFDKEVFHQADYDEMRRIIREEEPRAPSARLSTLKAAERSTVSARQGADLRRLANTLRGDLDWIVMKALEKRRSLRYESASSMARDVTRYLNDEPVEAGPPSSVYRLRKFVRKHQRALAVTAAFTILLLVASIVSIWQAARAYRFAVDREVTQAALTRERNLFYFNRIVLAERERLANNVAGARRLLEECPEHLRGWEWRYLNRICQQELFSLNQGSLVTSVAFAPDGQMIASGGHDHVIRIWDVATREIARTLTGHLHPISCLAFMPDSKRLVSSSHDYVAGVVGEIKVWDSESGQAIAEVEDVDHGVQCLVMSPDGRYLAYVAAEIPESAPISIWDFDVGRRIQELKGHSGPVLCLAFGPDGKWLVSGGSLHPTLSGNSPGEFRIWNVTTGDEILKQTTRSGPIWGIDVRSDGKSIATSGADHTVRIWDVKTGVERTKLTGHTHAVSSVKFMSQGRLASSGFDSSIMLWTPNTEQAFVTLRGHTDSVTSLDVNSARNLIVSASEDGTVKVWDPMDEEAFTLRGHRSVVGGVVFSPDGMLLASNSGAGELRIWDAVSGLVIYTSGPHVFDFGPHNLAFSPDGQKLAASRGDTVWILEATTGRKILECQAKHPRSVTALDFSPNGKYLASISSGPEINERGEIRVWNSGTGELVSQFAGHRKLYNKIGCLKYSADGTRLVTACGDNTAKVWNSSTGERIAVLEESLAPVLGVAISPDGRHVATATDDNLIVLWELATGKRIRILRGHAQDVISVAFGPDGKRLISGSNDHTVKVWDVPTGEEVVTLRGHRGMVRGVAFSSDGQRVAAGSEDTLVRIWNAAPITDDVRARRRAARMVNELVARPLTRQDVIAVIESREGIDPRTRQHGIHLAARYQERPDLHFEASMRVVTRSDANRQEYESALRLAKSAARLSPENHNYVNMVGMALYRVGDHQRAVDILTSADAIYRTRSDGGVPFNLAFLAMAHYALNEHDRARETLARLEHVMENPEWRASQLYQEMRQEAVALIK